MSITSKLYYSHSVWVKGIWIIISIIVAYCAISIMRGWGNINFDEAYQTWAVLNYKDMRTAPLTFWLGSKWLDIMGVKVLNLRLLTAIVGSLAVLISCIYAWIRTKNIFLFGLLLMVSMWCWRSDAFMLYNWDTGSFIWDVLALIAIVEYFRKPTLCKAILCGIGCGIMTLGRMPSGIIAFLWLLFAFLQARRNQCRNKYLLWKIIGFALAYVLVFISILWLTYGSPMNYFATLNQGVVSGHSLSNIGNYKWRLYSMYSYFAFIYFPAILCLLLCLLCRRRLLDFKIVYPGEKRNLTSILTLFAICMIMSVWTSKLFHEPGTEGLLSCSAPIVVGFLLMIPIRNFANPDKMKMQVALWEMWGCGIVIFSMIFGSDAYVERIEGGITLPVIVAILWQTNYKSIRKFVVLALSLWLFCCVGINLGHWKVQNAECNYTCGKTTGIYEGIRSTENIDSIVSVLTPAINEVKQNNETYILLDNRNRYGLIFGYDNGPSYNEFHFNSTMPDHWTDDKLKLLDHVDAIIYRTDYALDEIKLQKSIELMEKQGYADRRKTGGSTILRKIKK